jgi:membrane-bound serine protease (ClpP class)
MDAEWFEVLQQILTNPNVAYALLVLGLWAAVASWAVPGTGFPEAAAAICLVLAALGLARLPVNLIGLAMVVTAMGLFVLDLKVQSAGLTLGAAAGLALGSLFLFRPGAGAIVSRWLIGIATVGSLSLFGLVLSAAVRAQRLPVRDDIESLIGTEGIVTSDLDPRGTVRVRSELWTADADQHIPAGTAVQVIGIDGIRLHVAPISSTDRQGNDHKD